MTRRFSAACSALTAAACLAALTSAPLDAAPAAARLEYKLPKRTTLGEPVIFIARLRNTAKPSNTLKRYFNLVPDKDSVRYPITAITQVEEGFILHDWQNPDRITSVAEKTEGRTWGNVGLRFAFDLENDVVSVIDLFQRI